MKNNYALSFYTPLFILLNWMPLLGQVDISNSVLDIYYRGESETVGATFMSINGNAFFGASPQSPQFMEFKFRRGEKLARTLVDLNSQDTNVNQPIYLALFISSQNAELVAPTDSLSIVRWAAGESSFWLRIQSDPSNWVSRNGEIGPPDETTTVECWFGTDAQYIADTLAPLSNREKNLPFHTRNPDQGMEDDFENAVSTLMCLDVSTSSLTSSGSDSIVEFDPKVYESDAELAPGVYSATTPTNTVLAGSLRMGSARDRPCSIEAQSIPTTTCFQNPTLTDFYTVENQLKLNMDCAQGANTLGNVLRSGSYLTLYTDQPDLYGCIENSAWFANQTPGIIELSEPFEKDGQTLYNRLDLHWNGEAILLDNFLLETTAQLQVATSSAPIDLILNWRLTLVRFEEESVPVDQATHCGPSPFVAGSGSWHFGTWGCGVPGGRLFPHLTRANGGFTTDLILANTNNQPEAYSLSVYHQSGEPVLTLSGTLPAGKSQTYKNNKFAVPDGGYISLFGSNYLKATVVYKALTEDSGPAHIGEAKEASNAWRLYPGNPEITWDGMAMVNTGPETAVITAILKSQTGAILEQLDLEDAMPGQKQLVLLTGLFSIADEGSFFEVRSSQPLAITALRGSWTGEFLWENDAQKIP